MIKKYLVAFLISMVPLIELRGAVPFGLSNAMGPAFSGTQQILLLYIAINKISPSIYRANVICKKIISKLKILLNKDDEI